MLTIVYAPENGQAVPDNKVAESVKDVLGYYRLNIVNRYHAGTETLINQFRLAVLNDEISHTDIQIEFNGELLPIDENGRLQYWPVGMCDLISRQLAALVRGQIQKEDELIALGRKLVWEYGMSECAKEGK